MAAQTADGQPVLGLFTRPDSARLMKVLKKYARGLHFWSTGAVLPSDAPPSIERIFNMETRPADYWEPLLAAAAYARAGDNPAHMSKMSACRAPEADFRWFSTSQVAELIREALLEVDSLIASAILRIDKSPLRSEPAPYGVLAVETHG